MVRKMAPIPWTRFSSFAHQDGPNSVEAIGQCNWLEAKSWYRLHVRWNRWNCALHGSVKSTVHQLSTDTSDGSNTYYAVERVWPVSFCLWGSVYFVHSGSSSLPWTLCSQGLGLFLMPILYFFPRIFRRLYILRQQYASYASCMKHYSW